ncbi:MAG TPA: PqqD family protein [Propionibacteriaceae bacterium]|nr:PqqD family protein [Propionibacteriaceae bacterium]
MRDAEYRRHPDVASVADEGRWYVARVPDGPIHCLDGPAAVIWDELPPADGPYAASGDLVRRVALRVGVEEDAVRGDVAHFMGRLVSLGLLETVTRPRR